MFRGFTKKLVVVFLSEINALPSERTDHVVGFIVSVFGRMQVLYRFGLCVLFILFRGEMIIFRRNEFQMIECWRGSRIGLRRDFVRFFHNLFLLSYYDLPDTIRDLNINVDEYAKVQCYYNGGG